MRRHVLHTMTESNALHSAAYRLAILSLSVALLLQGVCCLRDVRVVVPQSVKSGDPAVLNCFFELEGEALYTVKWYRHQGEFFRYTPKESPPGKTFRVAGIPETVVEVPESNATQVKLSRTSPEMNGLYSCEVSADAPSFHTAMVSSPMTVVVLPTEKPVLTMDPYNRDNGQLRANCTAPGSMPAANITWTLNNIRMKNQYVVVQRRVLDDDLEQTLSQLVVPKGIAFLHFHSGRVRIRCVASIFNIYSQSVEKYVNLVEKNRPTSVNEAGFFEKQLILVATRVNSTNSSSAGAGQQLSIYLLVLWLVNLSCWTCVKLYH